MTGTPKMGDNWWKKEEMFIEHKHKKVREPEEDFDGDILVSPSRQYVIFYGFPYFNAEHAHKIALPMGLPNNEVEAVRYFFSQRQIDSNFEINNCLPYEQYEEQLMDAYLKGKLTSVVEVVAMKKKNLEDPQEGLNKSKLLEEIRISLASFYAKQLEDVADIDILVLLRRLERDSEKYLGIITTINRALKEAIRRKDE
jgi:hypothetical protein